MLVIQRNPKHSQGVRVRHRGELLEIVVFQRERPSGGIQTCLSFDGPQSFEISRSELPPRTAEAR